METAAAIVSNNPQSFCSGGSYTINGNTYTSAGTYTDVLTSVNGCDSTVITVITLSTGVSVSVTPSGPVSICDGLTSTLSSSVTNPNYTYQWSDANGVIVGKHIYYIQYYSFRYLYFNNYLTSTDVLLHLILL